MRHRTTWPLWYCISEETQTLLRLYQYHTYRVRLDLMFEESASTTWQASIESRDEIDKLMRQRPKSRRFQNVENDGCYHDISDRGR